MQIVGLITFVSCSIARYNDEKKIEFHIPAALTLQKELPVPIG